MRKLRTGSTGDDVHALQRALNDRAQPRHLPLIQVDGEYGSATDASVNRVSRHLGVREVTINQPGATIAEQRIIRQPGTRTPAQYARARARRREREKAAAGPRGALEEARRYIGRTEQPPNSNTAPWGLAAWIKEFLGLSYGVAWCGIFVGHCLRTAGVKVTGRVASVYFNYADAGAGQNGWAKRVAITDGQPGDAVGLFGLSTHIELIEKRVPGGYQTIGGNTSSGNTGSQSNGGGCYRRVRAYSDVVYVARPRYQ